MRLFNLIDQAGGKIGEGVSFANGTTMVSFDDGSVVSDPWKTPEEAIKYLESWKVTATPLTEASVAAIENISEAELKEVAGEAWLEWSRTTVLPERPWTLLVSQAVKNRCLTAVKELDG